jgi:hypothetical protein
MGDAGCGIRDAWDAGCVISNNKIRVSAMHDHGEATSCVQLNVITFGYLTTTGF